VIAVDDFTETPPSRPQSPHPEPPLSLEGLRLMVAERSDPSRTLDTVIRLVQMHFRTDVCSVYLLEPDRTHLVLAATSGLRQESVRQVRMGLHEGLAGLVAQESRPVMVEDAMRHARFKYFPQAGEEPYHSFLGLPLLDRGLLQGVLGARPVAYFSAEFGVHESVPIYSGGLGILAGDHVKSASDLGVPLIGVGLYYDQGHFHQYLDQDGWQHEDYLDLDAWQLPMEPATGDDGQALMIHIETRTGRLSARVWKLAVGRCTLLLLDSDVPQNNADDRALTARLYGGDDRTRIRQELLLGIGGVHALNALAINPGVLHMNEGYSAFAALEIARTRMHQEGIDFWSAMRRVARRNVFTTHTPVPAGHDRFHTDMVEEYLGPLRDMLGIGYDEFMGLGRVNPGNTGESFCMTVLAIRMLRRTNGVSALHGRVSRSMWRDLWPGRPSPIGHITNGVHVLSWLAPQMRSLYERHFGVDRAKHSAEPRVWKAIDRSAATCCSAIWRRWIAWSTTRRPRCRSCSRARRIRRTASARASCRRSTGSVTTRVSPARSCSSRTTT